MKNKRLSEAQDIEEQLSDTSKVGAGPKRRISQTKELEKALRDLHWIIKFSKDDIEKLNVHGDSWMDRVYQEYYQKYKKHVSFLKEQMGREDLDNKLKRRLVEMLEKVTK